LIISVQRFLLFLYEETPGLFDVFLKKLIIFHEKGHHLLPISSFKCAPQADFYRRTIPASPKENERSHFMPFSAGLSNMCLSACCNEAEILVFPLPVSNDCLNK
jgi:hypothetical protein